MTGVLSNSEMKKRSVSGAKWLILTNVFGMPAAYLIALILGQTGPTALGAYALAQIFIGVVTTFAMYGGPAVLRNYMPKIHVAEERGRFLFAYGAIILALMVAMLGLFYAFPSTLEFLLDREFSRDDFGLFVLLTFVVVLSECLTGAVSGLMKIKLAAIARLMSRIVLLPLLAALFVLNRPLLERYTLEVVLGGTLISYGTGALLCMVGLARDPRFHFRAGWHLPKGFGAFAFTSTAAMAFSFFYTNFDRMCVLGISDVAGLGMYQAVISLMMLIEYIPNMLQTAIVPVFSGLHTPEQRPALLRAFLFIRRNAVLLIAPASMAMIAFSREILMFFGAGYGDYYYLLALYSFVSVVRAPAFPALGILVSLEKNAFRLTQSALQLSAQVALTLVFIQSHGVLAIAGAKMLAGGVSTLAATLYVVYRMKMAPGLGRSYIVSLPIAAVMVILRIWVIPTGWLGSILLCSGGLILFALLARISVHEISGMIQLLTRKNFNLSPTSGERDH